MSKRRTEADNHLTEAVVALEAALVSTDMTDRQRILARAALATLDREKDGTDAHETRD